MTLGKLLNTLMLQFPHFLNRYNDTTYTHNTFVRNFEKWGLKTLGGIPTPQTCPECG